MIEWAIGRFCNLVQYVQLLDYVGPLLTYSVIVLELHITA